MKCRLKSFNTCTSLAPKSENSIVLAVVIILVTVTTGYNSQKIVGTKLFPFYVILHPRY